MSGLGRVITSVVAIAAVSGPEIRETLTNKDHEYMNKLTLYIPEKVYTQQHHATCLGILTYIFPIRENVLHSLDAESFRIHF